MMNTFKVQFFSPDNKISFDEVVSLSVSGLEGELMILAYYSPYLIYLLPGIITAQMNNQTKKKVVIDSGILEVANNNCSIVTNQIQVFDHLTHDEESLKNKRVGIYLNYLDEKFLS
ncbi:ATP synthase F1, epsilon subunit [Wolbachia endosymbiont of Armadillidium vulgare str. wVulC]|nr:F0F1 ATP synthase subunit epsilon [Wolbachia endosymbiont of Armadillidium vulgare]KLT22581.1 ATP synthase F1, epsilon subunit [Wolbachia endosymbiont of Armadillidium vulgare str. wVulC]OJH31745.1 ATP synthase epsilon chain [Wolbachia endosymbiont of Armadillidium vulgare]OJH32737.1 ATP synthase epsilon chain [Wolbachia endosymbiont of Armadillidium vulgare]OJH33359.1 ATP synthase epsilon chain [Wolbachia endosymbiont of Armadillidium vulgare]